MAIFFHGSFGLNRPYMAGILKRGLDNPDMRDIELAAPFGYKAPFAAKYRAWLQKTGIIHPRFPVRLTESGEEIYSHDPQLEQESTMWFMHRQLTETPDNAEAWHFFFKKFLPEHPTFTEADLITGLMNEFRGHSEEHFGPNSKMNPVIARKLIECYTEKKALGTLSHVSKGDSGLYTYV